MLLLIDNYDSFVHNLARYLRQLGQQVLLVRNDRIEVSEIRRLNPQAVVMSPGPGTPDQAGVCLAVVRELHQHLPVLGVCLGHQVICTALGATIVRTQPVHGRVASVSHTGHPLFQDIPSPFQAGRYHSLAAEPDSIPSTLNVIARLDDDELHSAADARSLVMAVAHQQWPIVGVQFHPESVLTRNGYQLLANFLTLAGVDVPQATLPRSLPDRIRQDMALPVPSGGGHRQSRQADDT